MRYDKCWNEALHVQEFEDIIKGAKEHGNSILHGPQKYSQLCQSIKIGRKTHRTRPQSTVLPHLQNVDVSHVEQVDGFFEGLIFYICSGGNFKERETLQVQIKRSGGRTVPNFVQSVTHVIACEAKGFQFQVAVDNDRDIICRTWISACIKCKKLLPISPRHYLFQSQTTKKELQMEIDIYGDPWFEDVGAQDIFQVLKNISNKDLPNAMWKPPLQQGKRKSGRDWHWGLFEGCSFYFHRPLHSVNPDSQLLAMMTLKRLQLQAEMLGASISCDLTSSTTHIIIYVPSLLLIPMKRLRQSFNNSEKEFLQSSHVNMVSHLWLEESGRKKERIEISPYLLSAGGDLFTNDTNASSQNEVAIKVTANTCRHSDGMTWNSNSHPVKKEPCLPAVEEGGHDRRRKVPCKRYVKSPKCSAWGESLKERNMLSREECVKTMEDTIKEDFCFKRKCKDPALQQRDGRTKCDVASTRTDTAVFECHSKLTMSQVVWESECLQDIAQVYLGSFCSESSYSVVDKGLHSVPESQPIQRVLVQDDLKAKEVPAPSCIPKRRFTTKGWL